MTGEREPATERASAASLEREVRLEGPAVPGEVIRARIEGGFYHTPAVVDFVARRMMARGDL